MTSAIHQIGGDKGPPAITSVISQLKDWRGRNRRHHQLHADSAQEHTIVALLVHQETASHGLPVTRQPQATCTNVASEGQGVPRIATALLVPG